MGHSLSPGPIKRLSLGVLGAAQRRALPLFATALGLTICLVLAVRALGQSTESSHSTVAVPGAAAPATPAATGAPSAPAADHELSRAQAIALVQGRYGARVVRTNLLQEKGGRHLYVFRLLSGNGKVWSVRIDAQTGAEVP